MIRATLLLLFVLLVAPETLAVSPSPSSSPRPVASSPDFGTDGEGIETAAPSEEPLLVQTPAPFFQLLLPPSPRPENYYLHVNVSWPPGTASNGRINRFRLDLDTAISLEFPSAPFTRKLGPGCPDSWLDRDNSSFSGDSPFPFIVEAYRVSLATAPRNGPAGRVMLSAAWFRALPSEEADGVVSVAVALKDGMGSVLQADRKTLVVRRRIESAQCVANALSFNNIRQYLLARIELAVTENLPRFQLEEVEQLVPSAEPEPDETAEEAESSSDNSFASDNYAYDDFGASAPFQTGEEPVESPGYFASEFYSGYPTAEPSFDESEPSVEPSTDPLDTIGPGLRITFSWPRGENDLDSSVQLAGKFAGATCGSDGGRVVQFGGDNTSNGGSEQYVVFLNKFGAWSDVVEVELFAGWYSRWSYRRGLATLLVENVDENGLLVVGENSSKRAKFNPVAENIAGDLTNCRSNKIGKVRVFRRPGGLLDMNLIMFARSEAA